MKTASSLLEQLEPRIAPAAVVFTNGANLLSSGDQGYVSEADSDGDATLLVKVTGGKALVFWDSATSEIKGISVSNGINMEVWGNVSGDIVTNLQSSGFLSDSNNNPADGLDGGKLLASSIAGIKTNAYFDSQGNAQNGDVSRIIAGGSVSNVNLNGRMNGVYAGDGIFDAVATASSPVLAEGISTTAFTYKLGTNFDTSGLADISTMTLQMGNANLVAGAAIKGVSFSSGVNVQFFAGDGTDGVSGPTLGGGSISKLDFVGGIVDATISTGFFQGKSYTVSAGNGGSATTGNGGAGGNIDGVAETGSGGIVFIHSGSGGNGDLAKGKGGFGGSISNLDLQGGVNHYDIVAGSGGNGAFGGSGGGVSFVTISSQGPISLAAPFLGTKLTGTTHQDFFVIDRSTGQMVLIDGSNPTLTSSFVNAPVAAGAVDAIAVDLNGDNYLDVAVVYADGNLGILINNLGDGTFTPSEKALGFEPAHILAGNFDGSGGNPELAIIGSSKLQTTVKLYTANGPTTADNFSSDPNLFKTLILKKGNLVDAVGGDSATGAFMQLNAEETKAHSDLVLAFSDGTLQGVLGTGDGTVSKLFAFTVNDAPKTVLVGGIRDVDFNFGTFSASASGQALAVVNKAGTAANVVTIAPAPPPEPVEGEPPPVPSTNFIFNPQAPLPLPSDSGSVIQATWTSSSLGSAGTALMLLTSNATHSNLLLFSGSSGGQSLAPLQGYVSDFVLNSTANNHLYGATANSYFFTTGNLTIASAYNDVLPDPNPPLSLEAVSLPFAGKNIDLTSGNGGSGTSASGGNGGDIKSVNFDSNTATITAGDGGTSASGAGGNGGSINNSASFRSSAVTVTPSMGAGEWLEVYAGKGANVTGSGPASKGGNGGNINGVIFTTTGYLIGPEFFLGSVKLTGGDGGNSNGFAAGKGGSISSTTVFNATDARLFAGDGGTGAVGLKATGGNGGSISGLVGGDSADKSEEEKTRFITGSIYAYAGTGGNSALARAGNGGNVSAINVQNMNDFDPGQSQNLILQAGIGGSSSGTDKTANGGAGGSVSGVTSENTDITPTMTAGNGGNASGGSGGAGGALSNLKYKGGIINLTSGQGGNTIQGTGGFGGALSSIQASIIGSGYMGLSSGIGGNSINGTGGSGGAITNVSFKLDPLDAGALDETLGVVVSSGDGGTGAKGGNGGLISAVYCEGVYNNAANDGFTTVIDSIAMKFVSGNGGNGTIAEGGNGGPINFTKALLGLSQNDQESVAAGLEALRVFSGDGGDGVTKGGAGGSISGLKAANVRNSLGDSIPFNLLCGADLVAGNGGDGGTSDAGAGGSITGAKLAVERHGPDVTGNLHARTGTGGNSTSGKGGGGGSILGSSFTSVNGNNSEGYGLLLQSGNGGTGLLSGGAGGGLSNLTISSTSVGLNGTDSDIFSAILLAGDGGNGTGSAKSLGGTGGSISGISQLKDAYSVINLIQAGSGGNSSADSLGGAGGSISSLRSSGAIGAQTAGGNSMGLFNTFAMSATIDELATGGFLHQGLFAGLGGNGLMPATNGSISSISSPAIAAIGAANLTGSFEQANVVTKITTLLLGFDIDGSGSYQAGDGYVSATTFNISKDLISLDPAIVSTSSLINRTTPFVNP